MNINHRKVICLRNKISILYHSVNYTQRYNYSNNVEEKVEDLEFRTLDLRQLRKTRKQTITRRSPRAPNEILPPRADSMPVDQDWISVWPGPRTFHPASVPLPIRQGYAEKGASPNKYGNLELMKIPNFLHLTPPAIKKHCAAIKKYCTKWPEELKTDDDCKKYFPLEFTYSDYCFSSPSIRNPLARVVTLQIPLSTLNLTYRAKDKFLRLVGERYDEKTDSVIIITDRCPVRKQNIDYALYLLTAVYHESYNCEDWEKYKSEADNELLDWENSKSRKNIEDLLNFSNKPFSIDDPLIQNYKKATCNLFDHGENEASISQYKEASKAVLFS